MNDLEFKNLVVEDLRAQVEDDRRAVLLGDLHRWRRVLITVARGAERSQPRPEMSPEDAIRQRHGVKTFLQNTEARIIEVKRLIAQSKPAHAAPGQLDRIEQKIDGIIRRLDQKDRR